MKRKRVIVIIATAGLVVISACILSGSPAVVSQPTQDATAAIQTQVAGIVAGTEAAETSLANALAATMASMVTITPEFTFTASTTSTLTLTPSFTVTQTLSVPMVSVSQETNCRTGPGDPYTILGTLPVGVQAEVVARTDFGDWIIKLPSKPSVTCWLWDYYATVNGDTSTLPLVTPVASPTPSASFVVEYYSIENCGGGIWGTKFKITNNGSVTWESNRDIVTDNVTHQSTTIDRNDFPEFNEAGCLPISVSDNLEPGEIGFTSSSAFITSPAGHSVTATIRVCSQDGLAGTCLEKTINFTP